MTPTSAATFRLDDELLEGLRLVKERDGIPQSEQVRRAILLWLESKGIDVTTRRPGAARRPRKR